MENVCERFPVITQTDNDEMLKSERFYWIRIVKKYNGNFQEFHECPTEIVKELALAVYQFFMARDTRSEKQWHLLSICPAHFMSTLLKKLWPLHLAAHKEHLKLSISILD